MSKRKAIAFALVALVSGSLAALVTAEIVLRVFDVAPTTGVFTVTEAEFRKVPGMYGPNQNVMDTRKPKLAHHVSINSLGYRGGDFTYSKSSGELRVFMFGDSFVYGDMVQDDETLPVRLEGALRRQCASIRVVNAGLNGSTITDQIKIVRRALSLAPDVAVLTFFENDIEDIAQAGVWSSLESNRKAKSRFPLSILYPKLRQTALWNLAVATVMSRRIHQERDAFETRTAADQMTRTTILRQTYRDTLRALRDELRAANVPLLLAAFPSHRTLYSEDASHIPWLRETAAELQIPLFDVVPVLAATGKSAPELYLLPDDGHARPDSYRLVGDKMAEWVYRSEPVSTYCPGGDRNAQVLN